eukprot:GHVL01011330.1.p1 GENE.GHVL01011330.1~~GHVL01011330.1.p1  ORF type:complete len:727 (-),score=194.31 GHVL01011330.1:2910-5090(-)
MEFNVLDGIQKDDSNAFMILPKQKNTEKPMSTNNGESHLDKLFSDTKMSKRKKKKLDQLKKKHETNSTREQVTTALKQHALSDSILNIMTPSSSGTITKSQKLALALTKKKSGIALDKREVQGIYKKRNKTEEPEIIETVEDELPKPIEILKKYKTIKKKVKITKKEKKIVCDEESMTRTRHIIPSGVLKNRMIINRDEKMENERLNLPAIMMEREIVESVTDKDISIICGSTGCGKSTQVPQFLLEAGFTEASLSPLNSHEKSHKSLLIGVSQPRRVAAISLAQRVGEELNDQSLVGYQVRYEKGSLTENTKIKFMTDGVLLREIQNDFLASNYCVIVIDEAHERSVNCDILIGLISRTVEMRKKMFFEKTSKLPPLRLVIMSATLRICDFTENSNLFKTPPPVLNIESRTHPVTVHYNRVTDEDYILSAKKKIIQIHSRLPPGSILVFVTGKREVNRLCDLINGAKNERQNRLNNENITDDDITDDEGEEDDEMEDVHTVKYSKTHDIPVAVKNIEEPLGSSVQTANESTDIFNFETDENETVTVTLDEFSKKDESTIENNKSWLGGVSNLICVPLYASLSNRQQSKAFINPSCNTRTVIIATNVAETAITLPNVRYVVDTGKEKKRQYTQSSGVSRFTVEWISKSSASQRSGRAGRLGPGHCYCLYSSAVFTDQFKEYPTIEMLNTPMDSVLLFMASIGIPRLSSFPFPTPPLCQRSSLLVND